MSASKHRLRRSAAGVFAALLAALPTGARAASSDAVSIGAGFAGMTYADSDSSIPPDTHAAAGPAHIVEVINHTVAVYNKSTGAKLMQQDLADFFKSVALGPGAFDPSVSYDELAGRFVIIVVQVSITNVGALLYAVSNTSNPLDGFAEMHNIRMDETGKNTTGAVEPDFPRLGWNADAHVIAMNMIDAADGELCDHVTII